MTDKNSNPGRLLSGHLLARNVIWSLLGEGLPLVVALWAIPRIIRQMGTDRFGLLSIVWIGIGYFSLFDLGIGRALTKLIAERLGDGREAELPALIKTGTKLMFALGGVAALVVLGITPWLTGGVLKIPEYLVHEAAWSLYILGFTLPFVVSTAGLIGILQAHQRFALIAAVRIPMGIMNFLGPVLALIVTPSLIWTTFVLAVCRLAGWAAYRWASRDVLMVGAPPVIARAAAKELLTFGGWVTISNVVSPLMTYCDRFVIGALLTMTAVTYYTTPFSIITRLSVVPVALIGVLFPALTVALAVHSARAESIFRTATRVLLSAMVVPVAIVMLFAHEGMALWLGQAFSQVSSLVLQLLAVGVFFNGLALLPYAVLQGKGRPDLTGKLHLAELPVYGAVLWWLVKGHGIVGAAGAWSLRVALDAVVLFTLGMAHVPELRRVLLRAMVLTVVVAALLSALLLIHALWLRVIVALAVAACASGWVFKDVISVVRGFGWAESEAGKA